MPVIFLVVSIVGALFTLNALHPFRRPEFMAVFSFFPGWLTSELPYHHLVWQAVATAAFIALGALDKAAGWVALGITLASWVGLWVLTRRSAATAAQMESALRAGLGDDYGTSAPRADVASDPTIPWRQIARPFAQRDPAIEVDRDIAYNETGGKAHRLDVYRPADGRQGCPTLFFIHGGGWVIGDKREQGLPFMHYLAARGWVCITVNHRLSPKATFPDHLLDLKQAFRWIREHAGEYGGDPSFVVVSGGSAGGHLAALVALTANNPTYQPGFEEVDTTVQGCVLWYGVYDFTNRIKARGKGFVRFIERMVMKTKLSDGAEAFAAASPMDLVRPDAPPTLIIQGSHDTLVPVAEARHFAELLKGVSASPVAYAELKGAQHGFEVFRSVRALHAVYGAGRFCEFVHAGAIYGRGPGSPASAG